MRNAAEKIIFNPANLPTGAYIYGLLDPQTLKVFYVGKTSNLKHRLAKHLSDAHKRKTQCQIAINELVQSGQTPAVQLFEKADRATGAAREKFYIRKFMGKTVNDRDGGGGRDYVGSDDIDFFDEELSLLADRIETF